MTIPLKPTDMQSLLTHDHRYQRAVAVLHDDWLTIMADETRADRQRIQPDDLYFAQALLASGAVTSQADFTSYAGVQALRQRLGNQLSPAAQQALIKPYL
ncbi:hypothetical protein [Lactiplantibacillus daowaiensis]|uniref:Uncharacterized protein n=1 Tax=Lactiplantibacillus daowaiensis TaxID=2559918 RepID=A0ABW1S1J6_9LACO|nr:hypothetical protein [Lactiplantibacillus daowaiensis]